MGGQKDGHGGKGISPKISAAVSKGAEYRHQKRSRPRSPLWAKLCVIFGALFIVVSATGIGAKAFISHRIEKNIHREDLLGSANRKNKRATLDGPMTFLILGTDKRTDDDYDPNDPSSRTYTTPGGARTDTIMLVHIPKGEKRAYVVSIPRDSYVNIPSNAGYAKADVKWNGGMDRINAAFRFGGAPLTVATVQNLTGMTIDYPMLVDFKAVREITDAVGGIDVTVDKTTQDFRTLEVFEAGPQHLNGKRAEAFVRQRKAICAERVPVTNPKRKGPECSLERGDYDRQARQQQFIAAVSTKLEKLGITNNPGKLDSLVGKMLKNVTVDDSMKVLDLAYSLRHLSRTDTTFFTLPTSGTVTVGGAMMERVDKVRTQELFTAIKTDTVDAYVAKYGANDASHGA